MWGRSLKRVPLQTNSHAMAPNRPVYSQKPIQTKLILYVGAKIEVTGVVVEVLDISVHGLVIPLTVCVCVCVCVCLVGGGGGGRCGRCALGGST